MLCVVAPRSRPRPASHSPGRPVWTKPTDGDSGLPETRVVPCQSSHLSTSLPCPCESPRTCKPSYTCQSSCSSEQTSTETSTETWPQPLQEDFTPAWAGSLKSSGGPKQWEIREQSSIAEGGPAPPHMSEQSAPAVHQPRVQNVHYGPGGGAPQYQQQADSGASDNASVQHLQYNTPIGLYSKQNVQEVLKGQTSGRPGEGTMQWVLVHTITLASLLLKT